MQAALQHIAAAPLAVSVTTATIALVTFHPPRLSTRRAPAHPNPREFPVRRRALALPSHRLPHIAIGIRPAYSAPGTAALPSPAQQLEERYHSRRAGGTQPAGESARALARRRAPIVRHSGKGKALRRPTAASACLAAETGKRSVAAPTTVVSATVA